MIANLTMYRYPDMDAAYARYWAALRDLLRQAGLKAPDVLSQDRAPADTWLRADLILGQTCGLPYRTGLHDKVTLVGTPDYGIAGCPPGYYRSVLIVREDDPRETLLKYRDSTFAFNDYMSQSGYAAPYAHVKTHGFWFDRRVQTHAHRLSAQSVAEGTADIAALDIVTWHLIQRYDPFATSLRVLERTEPTPGLPYITAVHLPGDLIYKAVETAIAQLSTVDRATLGLQGIVPIPKQTYLDIPTPPIHEQSG